MADPLERAALSGALTGSSFVGAPSDDPSYPEPNRNVHPDRSTSSSPGPPRRPSDQLSPSHSPSLGNGASHSSAKTGPKGVIADWNAAKGKQTPNGESSRGGRRIFHRSLSFDDLFDDLFDEDDEAVRNWRAARKAELEQSASTAEAHRREGSPPGAGPTRIFGHLREIGLDQFEHSVIEEAEDVPVVLLLYEHHIPACDEISVHLARLANLSPSIKFLRALASVLDFALDIGESVLPSILIYRAGQLAQSIIAVNREREWTTGRPLETGALRSMLSRYGLIELDRDGIPNESLDGRLAQIELRDHDDS